MQFHRASEDMGICLIKKEPEDEDSGAICVESQHMTRDMLVDSAR